MQEDGRNTTALRTVCQELLQLMHGFFGQWNLCQHGGMVEEMGWVGGGDKRL